MVSRKGLVSTNLVKGPRAVLLLDRRDGVTEAKSDKEEGKMTY